MALAMPCSLQSEEVAKPLELSGVYQEWLTNAWTGSPWGKLPRGLQTLGDVPFRVDGYLQLTGLDGARSGDWAPPHVRGVQVGEAFVHLHLLHGMKGTDRDGTPLTSVMFHYGDGTELSLRLGAGVHVRGWIPERGEADLQPLDPQSRQVWPPETSEKSGGDAGPRLFLTTLTNPRPDVKVDRLDLLSLFGHSSPFVVAMTVDHVSQAGAAGPTAKGRPRRRLDHDSEAMLRQPITVVARDAASQTPLSGAEAFLTVSSGEHRFFLDHQVADPAGRIRFWFPPAQTVSYAIWVRAPDRLPVLLERSRLDHESLGGEHTVDLALGVSVGGTVQDKDGKPVAGATVSLFRVRSESKRERTRMDYGEVQSGADGKWRSRCAPESLEGFEAEVLHAGFQTSRYRIDPKSPRENGWRSEDALKQQLVAQLVPLPRLHGTVLNAEKLPVVDAGIYTVPSDQHVPARLASTDSRGAFSFSAMDASGDLRFLIMAEGYAPSVQRLSVNELGEELHITVPRTKLLIGNIHDQNNEPIAGIDVALESWNEMNLFSFHGVTDSTGKFYWTNASPGTLFFRLGKANQGRANYSMIWEDGELSFSMNRPSTVVGRVVDATTGKPVQDFSVIRGQAYNVGEPMRWRRYNITRGRDGSYSTVLDLYSSNMRCAVMIEAQGYLPVESAEFSRAGYYTNDVRLTPGKGMTGVILLPDGKPAGNCSLALVGASDTAYLDRPGQLNRSSSYCDQTHTDNQGRFEFQPRLHASHLVAVHEQGIADVRVSDFPANGRVQLRKWGRVEGVFRVGTGLEPNQSIRLQAFSPSYYGEGEGRSAVTMAYKTVPDPQGRFAFDKVPPGDNQALVEYKFIERRNGGPIALSHGVVVEVEPGTTNSVILGGGGRRVSGKVAIVSGDAEAVDWLYDVHQLTLMLPPPAGLPGITFLPTDDPEARQRKQKEYQRKAQEFWTTPAGMAYQRTQRSYVLVFDTNGVFHIDNVPPGNYQLKISPNEIQQNYYSYQPLGTLETQVTVPKGGPDNAVFDLGTLELKVRGVPKMNRTAPAFEVRRMDGELIRSSTLIGKTVLLYFWASWANPSSDLAVLKGLQESYEEKGNFTMLLINVDVDKDTRDSAMKTLKLPGTLCEVGDWSQSPVVASYGIDGFPAAVVIDSSGKIASLQARGAGIKSAVAKAIRAATASAKP